MPRTQLYGRRPAAKATGSEFAWQVHAAMESWTARADVKASILLALQGGAVVVALTSREVVAVGGRTLVLVSLGALVLLAAAMCLATAGMVPALGAPRRHRAEYAQNMVYFGHVRLWRPDDLARRLGTLRPSEQTTMLARQLITLGQLNWRKHRLLQISVVLTIVSVLVLIGAAVVAQSGWWPGGGT